MRRFEATELFNGLEQNKISIWARSKEPRIKKLADLLDVLSLDRAKEILSRDKILRSEDDVRILFGVRTPTIKKYPVLTELLQKISLNEIMMLCLIDSESCFLGDLYTPEAQALAHEIQDNNEVIKDVEYLKEIFGAKAKVYQNNSLFVDKYLKPFVNLLKVLLEDDIEIQKRFSGENKKIAFIKKGD